MVLPHKRKRHQAGLILDGKKRDFSRNGTSNYKVLLVDDNVDLLDMAVVLFRQMGFEVRTATSGDEALEILRVTPDFDLLFTDAKY
jgi:response regulator RpfG family c-di-GMP phosphodiesterase